MRLKSKITLRECLAFSNSLSIPKKDRSKQPCSDHDQSLDTDHEDLIYAPNPFQKGDGRKREAKQHKSQAIVAKDEIDLEKMVNDHISSNKKIQDLEDALEDLKAQKLTKKELQS